MPERKIAHPGPPYLARNATDAPRRKNIDFWWKPQSPSIKCYSDVDSP
jgi:hypothetical protein